MVSGSTAVCVPGGEKGRKQEVHMFTVAVVGCLVLLLIILGKDGDSADEVSRVIEVVDLDNDDTRTIHRKVKSSGSWK